MIDEYRSLVGKLLYYTVKIGLDCANATRDLARHMSNPGKAHWHAMERKVGYLKGKIFYELTVMCVCVFYGNILTVKIVEKQKNIFTVIFLP